MDYEELKKTLNQARPRTKFFNLVKRYVKGWGHWKDKPRGKPGFHKKV